MHGILILFAALAVGLVGIFGDPRPVDASDQAALGDLAEPDGDGPDGDGPDADEFGPSDKV